MSILAPLMQHPKLTCSSWVFPNDMQDKETALMIPDLLNLVECQ